MSNLVVEVGLRCFLKLLEGTFANYLGVSLCGMRDDKKERYSLSDSSYPEIWEKDYWVDWDYLLELLDENGLGYKLDSNKDVNPERERLVLFKKNSKLSKLVYSLRVREKWYFKNSCYYEELTIKDLVNQGYIKSDEYYQDGKIVLEDDTMSALLRYQDTYYKIYRRKEAKEVCDVSCIALPFDRIIGIPSEVPRTVIGSPYYNEEDGVTLQNLMCKGVVRLCRVGEDSLSTHHGVLVGGEKGLKNLFSSYFYVPMKQWVETLSGDSCCSMEKWVSVQLPILNYLYARRVGKVSKGLDLEIVLSEYRREGVGKVVIPKYLFDMLWISTFNNGSIQQEGSIVGYRLGVGGAEISLDSYDFSEISNKYFTRKTLGEVSDILSGDYANVPCYLARKEKETNDEKEGSFWNPDLTEEDEKYSLEELGVGSISLESGIDFERYLKSSPMEVSNIKPISPSVLGERIRSVRKLRQVSQEELATTLGVVKSTISSYESGKISVPADRVIELANYLGVNKDFFLLDKISADIIDVEKYLLNLLSNLHCYEGGVNLWAGNKVLSKEDNLKLRIAIKLALDCIK